MEPILMALNASDIAEACRQFAIGKLKADAARFAGPSRMTYNTTGTDIVIAIAIWPTVETAAQSVDAPVP